MTVPIHSLFCFVGSATRRRPVERGCAVVTPANVCTPPVQNA
jgi:hypothetical protein